MLIRTLYGIDYIVDSPSHYAAHAWADVHIYFEGLTWVLTDGKFEEEYLSLNDAARRFRSAVDLALENVYKDGP